MTRSLAVSLAALVVGALMLAESQSYGASQEEKAKKAMAALQGKLAKLGVPKIDGTDPVAGKPVPAIHFGTTKLNNNFTVVDEVKAELGGTATIFVKSGDEYLRVSTNVLKDDGSRAIGTPLARNDAYTAISAGKEFCGLVDILGHAYDTCYSPIKSATGATIGIYYVGYRKK